MTQWEYLNIRVVPGGVGQEYVLTPQQADVRSTTQSVGVDQAVALLAELGGRGWELISATEQPERYWLKRPASDAERGPGGVYGIR